MSADICSYLKPMNIRYHTAGVIQIGVLDNRAEISTPAKRADCWSDRVIWSRLRRHLMVQAGRGLVVVRFSLHDYNHSGNSWLWRNESFRRSGTAVYDHPDFDGRRLNRLPR